MDLGHRDLACEEFLLHFIKYYVARQIQCLYPDVLTKNRLAEGTSRRGFHVFM